MSKATLLVAHLETLTHEDLCAAIDADFGAVSRAADTLPISAGFAAALAVVLRDRIAAERASWNVDRYYVATGVRTRQSDDGLPLPRRARRAYRLFPL